MTTLEAHMEEAVLEAAQNEYGDEYVELHTYVYNDEFDKQVISGKATVNTASRFTDHFAGMRVVMTNKRTLLSVSSGLPMRLQPAV